MNYLFSIADLNDLGKSFERLFEEDLYHLFAENKFVPAGLEKLVDIHNPEDEVLIQFLNDYKETLSGYIMESYAIEMK